MRSFRALKLFVAFFVMFVLQGMGYTAHRGFDWLAIAIIAPSSAVIATFVWIRRYPK
jgi:hypothetical protein